MTIPDYIKAAYLAIAAGSKLHEREAVRAIVWAVAQALRLEYLVELKIHTSAYNKPERDWYPADWLAEAEGRLRETEGKKDG